MKITKFRTYTPMEVIEEFTGELKHANMPALVEHLQDHQRAVKTEGFRELDGQLYFKIEGLWVKHGISLKAPSEILKMTDDELEQFDVEMLSQLLNYAGLNVFATKQILVYLNHVPAIRIRRLFNSKKKWYFDRLGYRRTCIKNPIPGPYRVIRPSTRYKKDMMMEIKGEQQEWANFNKKLGDMLEQRSK